MIGAARDTVERGLCLAQAEPFCRILGAMILVIAALVGVVVGSILATYSADRERAVQQKHGARALLAEVRRLRSALGVPEAASFDSSFNGWRPEVPRIHRWVERSIVKLAVPNADVLSPFMDLETLLANLEVLQTQVVTSQAQLTDSRRRLDEIKQAGKETLLDADTDDLAKIVKAAIEDLERELEAKHDVSEKERRVENMGRLRASVFKIATSKLNYIEQQLNSVVERPLPSRFPLPYPYELQNERWDS